MASKNGSRLKKGHGHAAVAVLRYTGIKKYAVVGSKWRRGNYQHDKSIQLARVVRAADLVVGWRGDIQGWLPLFKHDKALIINTTIFNEEAYQAGLGEAMKRLIDEFAFHYPGIRTVEHVHFYAVNMADEKTLQSYLERAYLLGKEFAR
jgi:putative NADPH-quinone reductase